jgi:F-type H+-transporting ATPase subunit b
MQIDWITVSAQIVNFLILVWLLKRFLYQPVIRAMERREQRIQERMDTAREREERAGEEISHYRERRDELDALREKILADAREEAEQLKREMLDDARDEVAGIRSDWLQQVSEEREEFLGNLRRESAGAIELLARKVLRDLADVSLEERIVHAFIRQLHALDDTTRKTMASATGPVRITSAFELAPALREQLEHAIQATLREDVAVVYGTSGELLCGIELSSGGRRLGWNLADYMDTLRDRIAVSMTPADAAAGEA